MAACAGDPRTQIRCPKRTSFTYAWFLSAALSMMLRSMSVTCERATDASEAESRPPGRPTSPSAGCLCQQRWRYRAEKRASFEPHPTATAILAA